MFASSNVTHRNIITEADNFITHITNQKNKCQNHTKWDTIGRF